MNTKEYKNFLSECKNSIDLSPMDLSFDKTNDLVHSVFKNPNQVRSKAYELRKKFIDSIDENLLVFERKFTDNKGVVHWCVNYNDFLDSLFSLLHSKKIKSVNTFDSQFCRELGLEESLKEKSIDTFSAENACCIFEPEFGIVNTGSIFSIFNSAYDMEIVMSSKMKIFILPINKFICNITDLELFSHILSIYRDNVDSPFLSSVFTPNAISSEGEAHVFLIDNGRSNILSTKRQKEALYCIDCGACNKVCPVYNTIGDNPYNNVFTGPLAHVVLPFLENYQNCKHFSFNCVLCGNCSKSCPVNIPISDLIIENRRFFFENKIMDWEDGVLARRLKNLLINRSKMNASVWRKKRSIKAFISKSALKTRQLPKFAKESFNVLRTKERNGK